MRGSADAAVFLQKRDEMVEQGLKSHRVTEYFAGRSEGSLRQDMEALAESGTMSNRLASELMSYAMCKLDDTWAEAAHRNISGQRKRAPSARVANMAATQRLAQNLATEDNLRGGDLEYFHNAFRKWKAIGQKTALAANRLRPVKKKASVVEAQVYRFDKAARVSWGALVGTDQKGRAPVSNSTMCRMQVEWLMDIVPEGAALSASSGSDDLLSGVRSASHADASSSSSAMCQLTDTFFRCGRQACWAEETFADC